MKGKLGNMNQNLQGFVSRLNELFDDKGLPKRGRQAFLSKRFKVAQPSAKKWLDGINYPEMEKTVEIAKWGGVCVEWLLTGRGVKHPIDFSRSHEILKVIDLMTLATTEEQKTILKIAEALLSKHQ